jgi:8-oxo-dGTP pyrophosphatase MutT (NUDIX family)
LEFKKCISFLEKRLTEPLPGKPAQYLMAPATRLSSEEYLEQFPDHRNSGVLLLLYPKNKITKFVLIERTGGGGVHSGQISLPGGGHEISDVSFAETALREAEEETGVNRNEINLLGPLSDLFIPVSKFRVYPYVGFTDHTPEFNINTFEVEKIIEADPEIFLMKKNRLQKEFKTTYGLLPAPYFKYNEYEIWGATAMIISEFIELFN